MNPSTELLEMIGKHQSVQSDLTRPQIIDQVIKRQEAFVSFSGALVAWTPPESTGRSPDNTYIVRHRDSQDKIDWHSKANNPLAPEVFDSLWAEAVGILAGKEKIYELDRVIGADSSYALPVKTVSDRALTALFADNMFRPVPEDLDKSIFAETGFTLLVLPYDKINNKLYQQSVTKRGEGDGDMIIVADMDRRLGLVYGSAYCGSTKKLMFTAMNYLLPEQGILPLHCSANEGTDGDVALLLGLSGTGKTTLSIDPGRKLIGDDEHGWSDNGVANFENGCYAKLINLNPKKEPGIHQATFGKREQTGNGCIIENTMMYPDGTFDLNDERLTPNSRASFPMEFLDNVKDSVKGDHPRTILFLTADANGVLPPVAKLTSDQAMLWFLLGYTSKLAGTETGVIEPTTTFSRFFGEPFMPRNPGDYASLLGEKIAKHKAQVYLVNTGWSGGPYGVGERMDITVTRSIVEAALSGGLEKVEYKEDKRFHIATPKTCPNVDSQILQAINTWKDKGAYKKRADALAQEFSDYFDKMYGGKGIDKNVTKQCPGK
ncbi:MAG: phosphoenolpyruvate carboxykinase (ATP) [Parcubacteria group bacterium]|nr:phosphoenolpyruvate carboxykinase (ATP) [Parcubacteria group bacterium]